MKKVLLIMIIALFAFTSIKTDTSSGAYVDFDDDEYVEIVRI